MSKTVYEWNHPSLKSRVGLKLQYLFCDNTDDPTGWLDPPNHSAALRWHPYPKKEPNYYLCCVLNSEAPSDIVWLGSGDRWFHFYSGKEFRKMATWVLWKWVWNDWFGLKTKLWLVGLRWNVHG